MLARPAPCHDADVSARDTEEFLVFAAHLRLDCLGLARWRDVVAFRITVSKLARMRLRSTRSPRITISPRINRSLR